MCGRGFVWVLVWPTKTLDGRHIGLYGTSMLLRRRYRYTEGTWRCVQSAAGQRAVNVCTHVSRAQASTLARTACATTSTSRCAFCSGTDTPCRA